MASSGGAIGHHVLRGERAQLLNESVDQILGPLAERVPFQMVKTVEDGVDSGGEV